MQNQLVHHSDLPYKVELAGAAEYTRSAFERIIDRGKTQGQKMLEDLASSIPVDHLVNTRELDFGYSKEDGITLAYGSGRMPLHKNAVQQLAARSGILTAGVMEKMAQAGQWGEEMLTDVLHKTFRNIERERVLVRAVEQNGKKQIRAVLSDRYRRMDSKDILAGVMETAHTLELIPSDVQFNDLNWTVFFVLPVVFEVTPDDPILWGFQISNSDYGRGKATFHAFLERLWCTNKARTKEFYSATHLGPQLPDNISFAEDTMKAESELMGKALRDMMLQALQPKEVARDMDSVSGAIMTPVGDLESRLKSITRTYQISKTDADRVGDLYNSPETRLLPPAGKSGSLWRLSNAFSLFANQVSDLEKSQELSRIAGDLLV